MEVENNKELVPFGHYCDQWKEMDPAARSTESGVPNGADTRRRPSGGKTAK